MGYRPIHPFRKSLVFCYTWRLNQSPAFHHTPRHIYRFCVFFRQSLFMFFSFEPDDERVLQVPTHMLPLSKKHKPPNILFSVMPFWSERTWRIRSPRILSIVICCLPVYCLVLLPVGSPDHDVFCAQFMFKGILTSTSAPAPIAGYALVPDRSNCPQLLRRKQPNP